VDSVDIKMESQDVALAACGRAQRPGSREREGVVDGEYQWCDPNNNGCHCCRRSGHQALYCMFNMPQHVKDCQLPYFISLLSTLLLITTPMLLKLILNLMNIPI